MHHNRFVLDKLWDEVATETNSTRQAVRDKWKALRDKFRQELQKKPVPYSGDPGGSQADWKSPWKHFENLLFLQDQFTFRTAGGSLPALEVTTDALDTEPTDHPTFSDDEETGAQVCPSERSEPLMSTQRKRNRPNDEVGRALIQLEQRKLELFEKKTQSSKDSDEDMAFLESLLPHVKSLQQNDKLLLRIKIQQLAYDFVTKKPGYANEYTGLQPTLSAQYPRPNDVYRDKCPLILLFNHTSAIILRINSEKTSYLYIPAPSNCDFYFTLFYSSHITCPNFKVHFYVVNFSSG